ncbi:MAG TPA: hypothetical protein VMD53_10655 [Rhizomicrobium sp.]|nr:hypothetical protein [Rhizomicrobium sp.]
MVAPIRSIFVPKLAPRCQNKCSQAFRRDRRTEPFDCGCRSLSIGNRLVPHAGQLGDPILERRVRHVGDAVFDRLIETLQFRFGLGDALAQLRDVAPAPFGPLLTVVEQLPHHRRQTLRIEQTPFQMVGNRAIELVHRHGQAAASGRSLPRLGGAGVIAIVPARAAVSCSQRHRATATRTEADAGQQGGTAHRARGHPFRVASFQMLPHSLELDFGDNRRHGHDGMFGFRLWRLGLEIPCVEPMTADVGLARENLVD